MSEFSHILHDLRTQHGLTQKELAGQLGVSYSTISMYERGHRQPDLEMLAKLAAFFGVSVDSFFGRETGETETPATEEYPANAALRQFARQKRISYEQLLRWFAEGECATVMRLRDPDGLVTAPPVPPPPKTETLTLSPHEHEVIRAYRQRPDVRPFVDKLLDV